MSFESGYVPVASGLTPAPTADVVFQGFSWENVGGQSDKKLGVIQTGRILKIFDTMTVPLSDNELFSYDTLLNNDIPFSFAVVDGILIVATGQKEILIFTYNSGTISVVEDILTTRDLFGVEDYSGSTNLTVGSGLTVRPATLTDSHRYNLRNQSFAEPRPTKTTTDRIDPIKEFFDRGAVYPSNSDAVYFNIYPDVEATNKTIERFHAADLIANPPGMLPAPRGYFIIDAMERGASRKTEYDLLLSRNSSLQYPLVSLPQDKTPGGASVVCEFAGRVWFGGFSGDTIDPDEKSPYLSSYVFFSRLVSDFSDITKCYQTGDPTAKDASDIVATDGGFIRISGAYGISGLKTLSDGMLVVASNGVWRIFGGDTGFDSTNYTVEKITEHGCTSPNSILEVDGSVFYWGDDGIYLVSQNELGDFKANNISQGTIQTFFDNIGAIDKKYCTGFYDSYERKVRWLYGNNIYSDKTHELILDVNAGAFYPQEIKAISANRPKVVAAVAIPPFRSGEITDVVLVGGDIAVVEGDPVTVTTQRVEDGLRESAYVLLLDDGVGGELRYTFGFYNDPTFTDWIDYDGVGLDAAAYMVTGYLTGGDTQRHKGVVSLTMHLERTEDGFEEDGEGNLIPKNPSSCILQSQWEWTNSAASNRWGREFQVYRYKRFFLPSGVGDPYDTGHQIITTKNKLRGNGRALSMLIRTEPKKDCRVLGWSMLMGVEPSV